MDTADPSRRRRIAQIAIVGVALLFILELIALAAGRLELAAACFVAFVILWFVLRTVIRRGDAAGPEAGRR